jgi:hypothetical protein
MKYILALIGIALIVYAWLLRCPDCIEIDRQPR